MRLQRYPEQFSSKLALKRHELGHLSKHHESELFQAIIHSPELALVFEGGQLARGRQRRLEMARDLLN